MSKLVYWSKEYNWRRESCNTHLSQFLVVMYKIDIRHHHLEIRWGFENNNLHPLQHTEPVANHSLFDLNLILISKYHIHFGLRVYLRKKLDVIYLILDCELYGDNDMF